MGRTTYLNRMKLPQKILIKKQYWEYYNLSDVFLYPYLITPKIHHETKIIIPKIKDFKILLNFVRLYG